MLEISRVAFGCKNWKEHLLQTYFGATYLKFYGCQIKTNNDKQLLFNQHLFGFATFLHARVRMSIHTCYAIHMLLCDGN